MEDQVASIIAKILEGGTVASFSGLVVWLVLKNSKENLKTESEHSLKMMASQKEYSDNLQKVVDDCHIEGREMNAQHKEEIKLITDTFMQNSNEQSHAIRELGVTLSGKLNAIHDDIRDLDVNRSDRRRRR